ncbi:M48 family metalloprotease [Rhodovulum euryhalinum]|uniref:Putative Zn-dependent protease n=1 Tax=Rhodovulum euryhalinum TaxID=35805 RepID=A0A4R2KW90_9RHOB|nr:M48 family metalloprotease [Rhodovulum euryhalinum]TCO70965.1 putative Zn-dependent protease [Rhodovulum euryhalinum]
MAAIGRVRVCGVFLVLALAVIAVLAPVAARAQNLIRDAEIEYALRQLTRPLAAEAGISASAIRVMVIDDNTMNAFVLDGQTVMIHSGLLLRLDNAQQAQAVIAHELAHIANGHITRRLANLRGANSAAAMGLLMSMAVAASGNAEAGVGLAMGTSSSAQRLFFAHTRAEESSADQAGARYMARAGVDPQAMVDVLDLFRGQEALSVTRQDPYVRTHPLTADRLRAAKGFAAAYGGKAAMDTAAEYWFARAKGKLGAFLQSPRYTLRKAARDGSDVGVMRRAIAHHRTPSTEKALAEMARLEAQRPNDAFVQELKGQILLESRRFGPAVNAYARAVALAPNEPLILAGHGRALLALDTANGNRQALAALEKARARDPFDPRMLRDLSVAYARAGNNGMASLATAERYAIGGRMDTAAVHARRAAGLLPRGAPGWLRAQDVLAAAENAGRRKK